VPKGDRALENVVIPPVVGDRWIRSIYFEVVAELREEKLIVGALGRSGILPSMNEWVEWHEIGVVVIFNASLARGPSTWGGFEGNEDLETANPAPETYEYYNMNVPGILNQPFFQVALPIMVTMILTVWALISTNNKRLDDIVARLGRIEDRLLAVETRLTAVERKVDALELKAWR
jgi:hypothetical protein